MTTNLCVWPGCELEAVQGPSNPEGHCDEHRLEASRKMLGALGLDHLPVIELKWPCQKCGAEDAPGCNIDAEGNVTDCSRCKERLH